MMVFGGGDWEGNKVMSMGSLDGINILVEEREVALPLSFICDTEDTHLCRSGKVFPKSLTMLAP